MANPQRENGHIDIANELAEAFCQYFPGAGEGQILWVILRKTYGWHKKEDAISISQFQTSTGLSRRAVIYALKNLESKNMIIVKRGSHGNVNVISFQKDYEEWLVQNIAPSVMKNRINTTNSKGAKVCTGAKIGQEVVQNFVPDQPNFAPTKETITKETITKTSKFDLFWQAYPKKVGKGAAESSWKRIKMDDVLFDDIMKAVEAQKEGAQWQRGYIPNPATWLNQRRWLDDVLLPMEPLLYPLGLPPLSKTEIREMKNIQAARDFVKGGVSDRPGQTDICHKNAGDGGRARPGRNKTADGGIFSGIEPKDRPGGVPVGGKPPDGIIEVFPETVRNTGHGEDDAPEEG